MAGGPLTTPSCWCRTRTILSVLLVTVFCFAGAVAAWAAEDPALEAFRAAKQAYYRNPAEAVELFKNLLKKHRDSEWTPEAYYWLAKSLEASKADRGEVIRAYALFLRNWPHHELSDQAAFAIADSYRNQRTSREDLTTALDRFQKFLREYPQSDRVPEAYFKMGDLHRALHDYDKAIETFGKVVKDYPQSPFVLPARMGVADSLFLARRLDESIEAYNLILDVPMGDGQHQEVRLALLDAFLDANRLQEAGQQAVTIRQEADDKRYRQDYAEFQTRCRLAGYYQSHQQYDAAVAELRAYMDRFPNSEYVWPARLELGFVYVMAEKPHEAGEQFHLIIAKHPRRESDKPPALVVGAYYGRAWAAELAKDYARAIEQYQYVVNTYPKYDYAAEAQKRLKALRERLESEDKK